jgi:hypothetical protein
MIDKIRVFLHHVFRPLFADTEKSPKMGGHRLAFAQKRQIDQAPAQIDHLSGHAIGQNHKPKSRFIN